MLKLENIKKTYSTGGEAVVALRGVSLEFRESEFVSILGPSGCGKTTMLNIIGGLDKYDSGDLVINETSTKSYKDEDWDAYRNHSIGFVFQSYNLISHQTILQNVELAMTLSGVSPSERKSRATKALQDVGLGDRLDKKPNQLSGGQMQRVAIARALVNNPEIILADEPTGALDSQTSIQIMEILKEISKTRLVIMVTHNPALAEQYSTRIVNLLDGELQSDSNPITQVEKEASNKKSGRKFAKTSMSMLAAMALSFKNLLTKKGRTITTSIAGSIGIVGLGLVIALMGGIFEWTDALQEEQLSHFPVIVPRSVPAHVLDGTDPDEVGLPIFPAESILHRDGQEGPEGHYNTITAEFLTHIENMETAIPGAVNAISFRYEIGMNVLAQTASGIVRLDTAIESDLPVHIPGMEGSHWQEMPDNHAFILSSYDLIAGRMASSINELMLVVDEYNRLEDEFFINMGIPLEQLPLTLDDFIGQAMLKLIDPNYYFQQTGDIFTPANPAQYQDLFNNAGGVELTIVGVLRVQENVAVSTFFFSEGLLHTSALTAHALEQARVSDIAMAQTNSQNNIFTGQPFVDDDERTAVLQNIGVDTLPTSINIFPVDFSSKAQIREYLDTFNVGLPENMHVINIDMADFLAPALGDMFDILPILLGGFAFISLIVSTIMIGLITYVSVMERTKEIGILRSVGARKKDISRVFTAETMLIGLAAGTLGVIMTYILTIPVNIVFYNLADIEGLAGLNPLYAILLIGGSMALTMIAGFFPSKTAAKKDPVEALRTE